MHDTVANTRECSLRYAPTPAEVSAAVDFTKHGSFYPVTLLRFSLVQKTGCSCWCRSFKHALDSRDLIKLHGALNFDMIHSYSAVSSMKFARKSGTSKIDMRRVNEHLKEVMAKQGLRNELNIRGPINAY